LYIAPGSKIGELAKPYSSSLSGGIVAVGSPKSRSPNSWLKV
jgi:hypothetical protein